mgnify:CR=1 FL=1|tara:strand:+ start:137 stop:487 length:351 start_codon:yes stop_codon:yes gene_type:complete
MEFTFGKATEITKFAKEKHPDTYEHCERVFIAPDTNDYHILRVIAGYGEDYEPEEGSYILEVQMIPKMKREEIHNLAKLDSILECDDGGNYAFSVKNSIEECLEAVDGGFGINNLQ